MIRSATLDDGKALQSCLRKRDYDEVWAAHGEDPNEVLLACIEHSFAVWCVEKEGLVAGVFGVAPSRRSCVGHPWMLGSDLLNTCRREFVTQSDLILAKMHTLFPVLHNYVDVRNQQSIRWLQRVGFIIEKNPVSLGPFDMEFYSFYREG